MTSQQDDDHTKSRTDSPAAMGYPPQPVPAAMGYPPPPVPAPYPGYPVGHNPYPYAAAPPAAYYTNGYPAAAPYNLRPPSFMQRIFIAMITAFVIIAMLYILSWFFMHPRYPVVVVDSLMVSNFTVADSQMNANWNLSFDIENPNRKLVVNFKEIEVLIFYGSNILSSTSITPFPLKEKDVKSIHEKLVTRKNFVDKEMEEERKDGSVIVNMRLRALATFQKGDTQSGEFKVGLVCAYLKLDFPGDSRDGKLESGPWNCNHYEI